MPKAFNPFLNLRISLLCAALLLFLPCAGLAQITNVTDDQATPTAGVGHDYIKMLSETVIPSNGQVSIRIHTPVPPGRKLTVPFAFAYDSGGVQHLVSFGPGLVKWTSNLSYLAQGGWAYSVPLVSQVMFSRPNGELGTCSYYTDYVLEDIQGGRHALGISVVPDNGEQCFGLRLPPQSRLEGGDDFLQATTSAYSPYVLTVADADGTVYHFANPQAHGLPANPAVTGLPDFIEDRNGNKISVTDSGNGVFSITDTLGRTAISSSGFGTSGNTVRVSGLSNPYTVYWGSASANFSVGSILIDPDQNCSAGLPNGSGSQPVISSLTLPDGQQYTFSYESTYGLLSQITYPTGGYVKYTWALNSQSNFGSFPDSKGNQYGCEYTYGMPAVSSRTVSFDGVNTALVQNFSYSTSGLGGGGWTSKQTVVITHDYLRGTSYTTTYNYTPVTIAFPPNDYSIFASNVPVERNVTTTDFSGNTLRTVNKNWVDQYEMQGEQVVDNGTVTSDQFFVFKQLGFVSGRLMTDKYECGSGETCYTATQTSPPTSYARHTNIQYASFAATPIYPASASILDRPSSVVTYDGSGSRWAETDYAYDGSGVSSTSSVVGHDYTNYSSSYNVRGNATSKSEWVNTTGSSLSWSYAYDDTGQPQTMTDPKSNATHYYFTDSFSGCGTAGGATNAYLTEIQDANGFTQSFGYRFCDGQLASSTDRNSQATSYAYSDSLNRLTSISYPDTGNSSYSYSGTCGEPSGTTILLQSGSNYTESTTLDGVCHITRKAVTSDPAGTDYTATSYDGMGRVWTVSNPYRSTSDPSYGVTTNTFDPLGRTTSVAYPDGSTAGTSYSGLCSTVTDPEGNTRTLCKDNLERLNQVTEGGLNATTSYTYDPLDDLTGVNQSGQTRSFTYDSLKRLVSAANPETGTTGYSYPTPSSVCSGDPADVCTRTDARSITTTYAYDALNRLTSKTYSDGTATASFYYDEASVTIGSWTSPSLAYPKGRETHTTTTSGSTVLTATVEDYDKMGRAQHYWQCTPLNCNTSSIWAALYNYDAAGDVTSWNHPAGFTLTQTINTAREVSQVTSSWSDSTHPATLATVTYSPFGSVNTLQNGCVGSGCTTLQETYVHNKRLQMAVAELGTTSNGCAT